MKTSAAVNANFKVDNVQVAPYDRSFHIFAAYTKFLNNGLKDLKAEGIRDAGKFGDLILIAKGQSEFKFEGL